VNELRGDESRSTARHPDVAPAPSGREHTDRRSRVQQSEDSGAEPRADVDANERHNMCGLMSVQRSVNMGRNSMVSTCRARRLRVAGDADMSGSRANDRPPDGGLLSVLDAVVQHVAHNRIHDLGRSLLDRLCRDGATRHSVMGNGVMGDGVRESMDSSCARRLRRMVKKHAAMGRRVCPRSCASHSRAWLACDVPLHCRRALSVPHRLALALG
jgi:hypothetical protein